MKILVTGGAGFVGTNLLIELSKDRQNELFSINQVFRLFSNKFNCESGNVEDQKGNYRETLRLNDDALTKLGWNPKGSLEEYISSL
jgi:nucleoside-diphosphate-sugar epimerase